MRYPEGREVMGVVAGSIAFAAPIQLKNGEIVGYRYDFPDPGPRATYDPRTHIAVSIEDAKEFKRWFALLNEMDGLLFDDDHEAMNHLSAAIDAAGGGK